MDDLLSKTKDLCRQYGITPARSKGQNFLIKEEVYDKIIAAADLKKEDTVLEVGPGLGFLTERLARVAGRVIAVELDDKLAGVLCTRLLAKGIHPVKSGDAGILPEAKLFDRVKNVEVINSDILKSPLPPFTKGGFKIVANLPYNITSIFLRKFLSFNNAQDGGAENKPGIMVLMLQKEVAERICAGPGKMSLLAVSVQFYAQPEIIQIVPKENFWPQPEVDSAIIKLVPFTKGGLREIKKSPSPLFAKEGSSVDKERDFFRLVKFGFSARRKMLKNNLAAGYHLEQKKVENWLNLANLNLKARAQDLSVVDWAKLFEVVRENML
jgi:16S rRNA (adenine1518-N6/adenine1519-N6)-dimethyltransferase